LFSSGSVAGPKERIDKNGEVRGKRRYFLSRLWFVKKKKTHNRREEEESAQTAQGREKISPKEKQKRLVPKRKANEKAQCLSHPQRKKAPDRPQSPSSRKIKGKTPIRGVGKNKGEHTGSTPNLQEDRGSS